MDSRTDMERVLTQAYDLYADGIYRFGVVKLSDREAAEDLVQDAFMRYYDTLSRGTVIQNERALLYTIARRLVIDKYRKAKSLSLDLLEEGGFEPADTGILGAEEMAAGAEALAKVALLPQEYREAIQLRFVEGFSPAEIAEITGETANAVSVRVHRGLKKLRELLEGS